MHDLNDVIAELSAASDAYYNRAHADGPEHENSAYNMRQGSHFNLAADFLQKAVDAAAQRAIRHEVAASPAQAA